jgi:excisionase family DNA binding protein
VLISFNSELFAFSVEQLNEARAIAAELMPRPSAEIGGKFERLVDAAAAAAQLGVSAKLLEDQARAGLIPHHKFGRLTRFRPSEVAAHCRVGGAPSPTDSQSVTPLRRLGRQ